MFRVRRNQNVSPHIHAGTRTLFQRDDGEAIQEVIEDLHSLFGHLPGDPIANLGGRRKDGAIVADLCESAQSSKRRGSGKCL